uniref:Non-haem dioxygenase N-terminal domain-containing protein n=2 Tax=Aegilops tauschii subsp. strangulata TaxID=200361 RepID=A0A452Y6T5_AEGTS
MVVLAKGELEQIALPAVHKTAPPLADVPEVDLAVAGRGSEGRAAAARAVAAACEEHGFFKVTGHGVPAELLARVENAAAAFFALSQRDKEAAMSAATPGSPFGYATPGSPFGYASKRIGNNGDLGWVEYLLLGVTAATGGPLSVPEGVVPSASLCSFRDLLNEYTEVVRRMTCQVLELMAEGLGMDDRDAFTRLVLHKESDSMLRVNHYPPRPELKLLQQHGGGGRVTGFGEHTDPQIISVLRSTTPPPASRSRCATAPGSLCRRTTLPSSSTLATPCRYYTIILSSLPVFGSTPYFSALLVFFRYIE